MSGQSEAESCTYKHRPPTGHRLVNYFVGTHLEIHAQPPQKRMSLTLALHTQIFPRPPLIFLDGLHEGPRPNTENWATALSACGLDQIHLDAHQVQSTQGAEKRAVCGLLRSRPAASTKYTWMPIRYGKPPHACSCWEQA